MVNFNGLGLSIRKMIGNPLDLALANLAKSLGKEIR
jgi:hypothetical protein